MKCFGKCQSETILTVRVAKRSRPVPRLISREGCGVNSNILIAFAAGAVIASGIVYIAVRPEDAAPLPAPVVVRPQAPVSVAVAQVDPAPAAMQPPMVQQPEAAPVLAVPPAAPVREKPSPLRPPPVRLSRPVVIARNEPLQN